ncbi:metal ABC transporter permease [Caenimonas sedimenti]|uniref:Metal ABC transporter permease n=1 Tax=Caenimonas sedimenti TaxID=2596921 RepID=A0A562ZXP4_9BURK|nr:metal ABC transporter permease [Caenimonas sedimenti]TWO73055.1 metal ABC transporter permease [Caenimonas sedimenti]
MTVPDMGWILAPAAALLAACILLAPLGAQVLARGVVFIDLAVAQVAACGVLVLAMLVDHPGLWATSASVAVAALTGAALVWWLASRWPAQREALIGLVYVAGAGISVMAASLDPHGRERLTALLAADVLWAAWPAVALLGIVAALVLMCAASGWLARDVVFYPVFALALSAAVPVLGLYLVFALLIAPALWSARGVRVPVIIVLAAVVSTAGLAASWALDLPSGACVAVGLCVLGIAAIAGRPG